MDRWQQGLTLMRDRSESGPALDPAARVCLHFHPDADVLGRAVLAGIVSGGAYLSQFATGTGNGGLTARPGGDRWAWEHRLFGGTYDHALPAERPVYGALALDADPYGPAPRFGSAFLRLRADVMERTSFAYPDSTFGPSAFGVAASFALDRVRAAAPMPEPLDGYIEAHVHGGVLVPADVEALVIDPSHEHLAVLADSAGIEVERHPGYVATIDMIAAEPDYRGEAVVDLARLVAQDGVLTPAILGRWRGQEGVDARALKQLWHCVARFGRA